MVSSHLVPIAHEYLSVMRLCSTNKDLAFIREKAGPQVWRMCVCLRVCDICGPLLLFLNMRGPVQVLVLLFFNFFPPLAALAR